MTLIELLTTLILTLILTTLGTSSWTHFLESNRANTTSNQIIRTINLARLEAIKSNQTITITGKNNDWSAGQVIKSNTKIIHSVNKISGNGKLSWSGFGSKEYLKINANGFLETQNGTFTYQSKNNDPKYQRKVIVNKAGRARSE